MIEICGSFSSPIPVDLDSVVSALARRDGIRIMPDGMASANYPESPMAWNDRGMDHASAFSKAVMLRDFSLNSTPMRWTGAPAARYFSA